jgi:hypothetical protein
MKGEQHGMLLSSTLMDPDLLVIILGFIVVILVMAFILNPPEAWVKRAFGGKPKNSTRRNDKQQ